MKESYLWALCYLFVVFGLSVVMMTATHLLGPRRRSKNKLTPYESGIDLVDTTRKQVSVKFYLVATLFILLDIETVFLIPWAVIYPKIGIVGIIDMAIFLVLVIVAILYIIRRKALDWDRY